MYIIDVQDIFLVTVLLNNPELCPFEDRQFLSHIVGTLWHKLPQFSLDCNDCLHLCLVYMYIKDVLDIFLVTVLLNNPELCPFEDRHFCLI